MKRALVLGGAENVFEDAHAAMELCSFELIVAAKRIVAAWSGPVHVFATLHANDIGKHLAARRSAGYATDGIVVYAHQAPHDAKANPYDFLLHDWAGSSGLFGVQAALHCGATRVVCAGCPLDVRGHFDKDELWEHAPHYRKGWKRHAEELADVRSMSGWTASFLGRPTVEWLNG